VVFDSKLDFFQRFSFIARIFVGIGRYDTAAACTSSETEDHGDTKVEKDKADMRLEDRDVARVPSSEKRGLK